jgi:PLP dependent protein
VTGLTDIIAARLDGIRERMGRAAGRAGRAPDSVRLVAVSKTYPIEYVRAAVDAGQLDFGENKVQEGLQKIAEASDTSIRWHVIGHLQSNKARKAAEAFDWIHAVDSVDLLRKLDQGASAAGRRPKALVQVDLASEATKFGAPPDAVPAIFAAADGLTAVELTGLMLLPPAAEDPNDARPWFRKLVELRDGLAASGVPAARLTELSMGMSHDFEVAIEEGATIVRIGSAIFGERQRA